MKSSARGRRWLAWLTALLLVFTVVGFLVLPPIVKAQAEKRLSAELGRTVTVGKVKLNPYALSMTMENFDVRERDGRSSFLGWRRLYVNFDLIASVTGSWVLGAVELDGFHAAATLNADGSFNFSDLLAKFASPAPVPAVPADAPRPIRVVSLKVTQAQVVFADFSRKSPFTSTVGPVSFVLTDFRTAGAEDAPYRFAAVTESGEKLAWSGTLTADPIASRGEFEVANIVLKKYAPYLEDRLAAEVADGLLGAKGRYEANLSGGTKVLKLDGGEVHVRRFKLADRSTPEPALEWSALDVTGIAADAVAMKATVARVALADGQARVRREKDGSINLLTLLQPPSSASSPAAAPGAAPAPMPDVSIAEVSVSGFAVELTDLAAPRPATLALSDVKLELKNVSLQDGAVIPLDLAFAWAPQGKVQVQGTVGLKPALSADLHTEVSGMALLPLSPYLEQFAQVRLTQGSVTTANAVRVTTEAGKLAVHFDGDLTVQQLGLVDAAQNEDLAGFTELKVSGIKASTAPVLTVAVAEVNVAGPYARIRVNADKSINLLAVAAPPAASPAASAGVAAPAEPPAARPRITVGKVVIGEGDFSFSDRSVTPNVRMAITQFSGTVTGLSSENVARADVDLKGVVDGAGPVAITGQLDPLGAKRFVDLKVDFKNVDLLPISPYTGKYAGYELARGKLVVDAAVKLDGRELDAKNVVTLHQFTFGAPTNSPDATGLPVRLGVALLKDSDGKIVIDLPVQGSLDDPNFRIGKVVMRVIVNLLTKVATSPFALLGSMFGGGGDELAFQEFAPGSSELQPGELPKLATMVKALANRPGLSLGIEGSYDAAADTYALRRQKLEERVRRQVWEEKHTANPNIAPPSELTISAEERAAMVKALYDAQFPPGTEFGAPLAAAPAVSAAPAAPKPGLFRRVINVITFQGGEKKPEPKPVEPAPVPSATPGIPLEEMSGRLAEAMPVTDDDLRALAMARAQRVRDHLLTVGHIVPDRLFLAQESTASKPGGKGPRVFLSLQ